MKRGEKGRGNQTGASVWDESWWRMQGGQGKRGAHLKHERGERRRGDHKQWGREDREDREETPKTVREKKSRQAMGECEKKKRGGNEKEVLSGLFLPMIYQPHPEKFRRETHMRVAILT
ncbi:hypothetical protein CHARACLAT_001963 [Characodon lateralis]|uniref:Uncharacterized protein n=1 Tax=Characodon lateralis TaxID=208331 RepID=A0ABU7CJS1_9TELE|nr:hypothetical protein [Characodon lateralis]